MRSYLVPVFSGRLKQLKSLHTGSIVSKDPVLQHFQKGDVTVPEIKSIDQIKNFANMEQLRNLANKEQIKNFANEMQKFLVRSSTVVGGHCKSLANFVAQNIQAMHLDKVETHEPGTTPIPVDMKKAKGEQIKAKEKAFTDNEHNQRQKNIEEMEQESNEERDAAVEQTVGNKDQGLLAEIENAAIEQASRGLHSSAASAATVNQTAEDLKDISKGVQKGAKFVEDAAKDADRTVENVMDAAVDKTFDTARDTVKGAATAATSTVTKDIASKAKTASTVEKSISEGIGQVKDSIVNMKDSAKKKVKDAKKSIKKAARDMPDPDL